MCVAARTFVWLCVNGSTCYLLPAPFIPLRAVHRGARGVVITSHGVGNQSLSLVFERNH